MVHLSLDLDLDLDLDSHNVCVCVCVLLSQENNTFVGTEPKYWECPQNWGTVDGVEAKSAPCGKDRAFFRDVT